MHRIGNALVCLAFGLTAAASSLAAQDFVLRAGDAIRLIVPGEAALSDIYDVDPQGAVTLPLIGRMDVAKQSWQDVRSKLLAAYRRELREPGINVIPLRRVLVLGAVNKPGSYLLAPTVSLSGAIATASGAVADGSARRIRITRGDSTFLVSAGRDAEIADMPVQSGDQIFVLQRNWFARNSNFLITALLSVTGIVATIALR